MCAKALIGAFQRQANMCPCKYCCLQQDVNFAFAGAAVVRPKYCLSHAHVLALPDPKLPYEVVVDASDFGLWRCATAETEAFGISQLQVQQR